MNIMSSKLEYEKAANIRDQISLIKNFYKTCGIDCDVYISKVNHTGPKVLK